VKVWLDLANSPHPLLFSPVARELQRRGHDVLPTARDNAQTVELAHERFGDVVVIGGESPRSLRPKAVALARRAAELRGWARAQRPDVALSHNSYAQIVAARALRMPIVTAMDFEHQPANHLAFRAADAILVPDVMPRGTIRRQGARAAKVRPYAGMKEELYLGDFEPDGSVAARLELDERSEQALVVLRTPPGRAIYHRFENPLFVEVLKTLGAQPQVRVVVLTRVAEQRHAIAELGLPNCVMPDGAIDARSLLYAADLVIGAGGTMTREAALLGVPTFSVFAGRSPAVDRALEARGLLQRLRQAGQVSAVRKRGHEPASLEQLRRRGAEIVNVFADEVERAGER
jgi:predicted glycosyltransferase